MRVLAILSVFFIAFTSMSAQAESIAEKTASMTKLSGLFDVYVDDASGKIYWHLTPQGDHYGRYIYAHGLTSGLGSNPIGLDRGLSSGFEIVHFERLGDKLFIHAENTSYRATSGDPAEQRAVRHSFASSMLWAGKIEARDGDEILVDVSDFLVRDATGSAAQIKARGEGSFSLDKERSVVDTKATLAFPDNLEFDAILTFESAEPGQEVRSTAAIGTEFSLIQHHSLIRLPEDGYKIREADPRAAVIEQRYVDYSADLKDPLLKRLARRFRLEKTDPQAERSTVKKPIIYYVDNGAPEPVRQALIDGISWWAEAFDEAGFIDAFQVKVLPEDAHPMDVRYNVVQWVHRATRGWSYGDGISDPRTGEMIKAMVILGSQRVRQDRMIFEGLVGADKSGSGGPNDPEQVALARIRQLGAHEVGHTLGFQHNMGASTYGDRASVMDYPAPEIHFTEDGEFDLSQAYGVGIGSWDKFTIKWLYSEFPEGIDENKALDDLVAEADAQNLLFVSDADARPLGAAHPLGNLWDTGTDPIKELDHILKVRKKALNEFGVNMLGAGRPVAELHEVFVPIYLLHRFQLQAAAKSLGGLSYGYPQNDGQVKAANIVNPDRQRLALHTLLKALEPSALDIRDDTLALLTPDPEIRSGRERFKSDLGPAFDAIHAAEVAGTMVFKAILHPARAGRLVDFHRRDSQNPGLEEVLAKLSDHIFDRNRETERLSEIRRALQRRYVAELIDLATQENISSGVKTRVEGHLESLADTIGRRLGRDSAAQDNAALIFAMIERHRNRTAPIEVHPLKPVETPPGQPIGDEDQCWLCGLKD
ncbi:MAG: zinc-dependent metalloprotease [Sphingomonadales bacterium]|jgi:hypothetical protein